MAESSDDEDYVTYGTALNPLDEDEARKKPLSLEDQVVKDKQGRRRFHGAFTGGFSAGYFNSVGTKEGWAPSTFVSSRGERAHQSRQTAEDFMDEDDLGDFGIAPRKIVTAKTFSNEEQTRKRQMAYVQHHAIPGNPPLPDLIVPSHESIGVQLLKKMGWKHGQGVGPKARRRRKKHVSEVKTYGCARPPLPGDDESENDTDVEDFASDFLFAPKDNQEFSFRAKDDYHGIGYQGLDPSQAVLGGGHVNLFGDDRPVYGKSGKKGLRGQAFGVGAFEVEDDDIYSSDHMSRYDKVLGGEEPGDGKYGWTAPKQGLRGSESVLEGFILSSEVRKANTVFQPPVLPRNFRPFHSFESSISESSPTPSGTDGFKSNRFTLSAPQRAAMLGEEQLPGPTCVFDMISNEDKNKLKDAQNQSQQSSKTPPLAATKMSQLPAGGPTASDAKFQWASGAGFQPFAKDPDKQRRYEAFLARTKRSTTGSSLDIPLGSMTEWERQRENEEFARAANLYRPLSGLMATRFVSAKQNDGDTVDVAAEEGGDKSDQTKAAEMKMFGKLTRDTFEWHPDKLLCKRFNIADPFPESSMVGLPKVKKDTFSVFNFLTISNQAEEAVPPPQILAITSGQEKNIPSQDDNNSTSSKVASQKAKSSSRWDQKIKLLSGADQMSHQGSSDSKTTKDPAEEERPPIDLFKAIFESDSSPSSSSEDEDNENDGDDNDESKEMESKAIEEFETNLQAHEDAEKIPSTLREINQSTSSTLTTKDVPLSSAAEMSHQADNLNTSEQYSNQDREESEGEYGPSLPPSGGSQTSKTDQHYRGHDRTSKYESYLETYSQSRRTDRHESRTHERTSKEHKSRSRGRHHGDRDEVRGQRSHSPRYSDDGSGSRRSKHSHKERHKEKHSSKERHKHKKEKKSKKKKKKQDLKPRHKERRKRRSSASSDYDASDDTGSD